MLQKAAKTFFFCFCCIVKIRKASGVTAMNIIPDHFITIDYQTENL